MAFWPKAYTTQHEVWTKTPDGRDLAFLTGYAIFDFKGTANQQWRREDLYMKMGPKWTNLQDVAPVVSLASISNVSTAVDAGWAVDNCRWGTINGHIHLQCRLAVRDVDGYIHRVAYHITAIGKR